MCLNQKIKTGNNRFDFNWFLSMFDYSESKKTQGFLAAGQKRTIIIFKQKAEIETSVNCF